MSNNYSVVILDIEGTICPISFVKEELFPFFLSNLPAQLQSYQFPLTSNDSNDTIMGILCQFPKETISSKESLLAYIHDLVARDIKDRVLKQLQGFIWEHGYTTGSISAPLFPDAIESIPRWVKENKRVYIYSSGSVKAQKLLLANVEGGLNLNEFISGYFDTTNAGNKTIVSSYATIAEEINTAPGECLFLSDNPLEVKAALQAGFQSSIIDKPGNYPLLESDVKSFKIATDLSIF